MQVSCWCCDRILRLRLSVADNRGGRHQARAPSLPSNETKLCTSASGGELTRGSKFEEVRFVQGGLLKVFIAICMTLFTLPVRAQQPAQNLASVQLKEWVSAFSGSDAGVFRAFVQRHYPSRLWCELYLTSGLILRVGQRPRNMGRYFPTTFLTGN